MGLFDLFKSKKKEGERPEPGSKEAKAELAEQRLEAIAAQLEGGQINRDMEEGEVDLRASAGGFPVKVTVSLSSGSVAAVMKAENRLGDVNLIYAPSASERPADADDPFGDDDIARVCVAKGVFVETLAVIMDEQLAAVQRLPRPFLDDLVGSMPRLGIDSFTAGPKELRLSWRPSLHQMEAPQDQILGGIRLLHRAAGAFASGDQDLDRGKEIRVVDGGELRPLGAPQRARCGYCSTLFLVADRSQCPNCGAAYTG